MITYNGAMILDSADGRVLYRQELKADDARLILEAGLNYDTTMCIWSDNKLYGNKLNDRIQEYSQATKVTPLLMPSIDELLAQGITKILWYDDVSQIQQIEKELRKTAHFHNVTFAPPSPSIWSSSTVRCQRLQLLIALVSSTISPPLKLSLSATVSMTSP